MLLNEYHIYYLYQGMLFSARGDIETIIPYMKKADKYIVYLIHYTNNGIYKDVLCKSIKRR